MDTRYRYLSAGTPVMFVDPDGEIPFLVHGVIIVSIFASYVTVSHVLELGYSMLNPIKAYRIGKAHEEHNNYDLSSRSFTSLNDADSIIDLLNKEQMLNICKKY